MSDEIKAVVDRIAGSVAQTPQGIALGLQLMEIEKQLGMNARQELTRAIAVATRAIIEQAYQAGVQRGKQLQPVPRQKPLPVPRKWS